MAAAAAAAALFWAYVIVGGRPGFSLSGTVRNLAPVVILAVPVCAVGGLGLTRKPSTQVPFWALVIGAVTVYLGVFGGAFAGSVPFDSSASPDLPPQWYGRGIRTPMTVAMGDRGRLVIPAAIREQLHLRPGANLSLRVEDGALILMTPEAADRELLAMFADLPVSLADELFADRRAEAERETSGLTPRNSASSVSRGSRGR